MNVLLATFIASALVTDAEPTRKWELATTTNVGQVYVDQNSIDSNGTTVSVTHRLVFANPEKYGLKEIEFYQTFNCKTRQAAIISSTETSVEGRVAFHVFGDGPSEWKGEANDKFAAIMIPLACGPRK